MNGLDQFVWMCWFALGLIPVGIVSMCIIGGCTYFVRSNWHRAGENAWKERVEKIKAER